MRVDESGDDRFAADIDLSHAGFRHCAYFIIRAYRQTASTGADEKREAG
jgi:hypothetical protein